VSGADDTEVAFSAADGWSIGGLLARPIRRTRSPVPGVVMVPGSRHERDAYTEVAGALSGCGITSLRIDVRGRGASRGSTTYATLAPSERRRVSLDVAAALDHVAACDDVDVGRLALVAEQDTAADALEAVADDERVSAVVLISARNGGRLGAALAGRTPPVLGLVSKEDREGLRATVDGFLAGRPGASRLEVFAGLGIGTTMFSARRFEYAGAEPLEDLIAAWLATCLA
jgi:dienelactone hydrolase